MKYRYIAIEGNIGAGKTTLAQLLSRHFNSRLILEEFEENSFLPRFYKEPERYAFPLEMSFLASRYTQLKQQLLEQDLFQTPIVADYTFSKCLVFAKSTLREDEYQLYQKLFEIIKLQLPQPDLLIFLHTPLEKLKRQIRKRGRSYEQHIPDEYLQQLGEAYREYLHQHLHLRILLIDNSSVNFQEQNAQFEQLLGLLEKDYESGIHKVSFL